MQSAENFLRHLDTRFSNSNFERSFLLRIDASYSESKSICSLLFYERTCFKGNDRIPKKDSAFFEIYKICIILHHSEIKMFAMLSIFKFVILLTN